MPLLKRRPTLKPEQSETNLVKSIRKVSSSEESSDSSSSSESDSSSSSDSHSSSSNSSSNSDSSDSSSSSDDSPPRKALPAHPFAHLGPAKSIAEVEKLYQAQNVPCTCTTIEELPKKTASPKLSIALNIEAKKSNVETNAATVVDCKIEPAATASTTPPKKVITKQKPKKSIFDIDFDDDEEDPLELFLIELQASINASKAAKEDNQLLNNNNNNLKDNKIKQDNFFVDAAKAQSIYEVKPIFKLPKWTIQEDPNCAAKQRFEVQTNTNVTDFHVNALHNFYIPNINGNWHGVAIPRSISEFTDTKNLHANEQLKKNLGHSILWQPRKHLEPFLGVAKCLEIFQQNNEHVRRKKSKKRRNIEDKSKKLASADNSSGTHKAKRLKLKSNKKDKQKNEEKNTTSGHVDNFKENKMKAENLKHETKDSEQLEKVSQLALHNNGMLPTFNTIFAQKPIRDVLSNTNSPNFNTELKKTLEKDLMPISENVTGMKIAENMPDHTHEFKKWHQAVKIKSYDNEPLAISPYVLIE